MHLRLLIDGNSCRLSERTTRRWVCRDAPELAAQLTQDFAPLPYDRPFEYREALRLIRRLTNRFGERLTIQVIRVDDAYTSTAQRDVLRRLCGVECAKRQLHPEDPALYFRSKVDFRTEVPVSDDVDLDLSPFDES